MNRLLRILSGAFLLFLVDRASKWLALHVLPPEGLFIIPKTVGLTLERNQGIAYSLPLSGPALVTVVSLVIIVLITLCLRAYHRREWLVVWGYSLIIVGAFSNLLDRLHYGYVVDMIALTGWPVFNIADALILAGVIGLAVIIFRNKTARRTIS
jgi:signal peptidase II